MTIACKDCRYCYRSITSSDFIGSSNVEYGECRLKPPVARFGEYQSDERSFPIVRVHDDWCGSFTGKSHTAK
ncbi:hypothetical protein [Brucella anthropi]|uniref:Uncharacterized protein n=1 Tax=Brucella anthropi TaxID=529 RepID=A0A011V643_BRUAN|nr:hypothetical protein [Brucella anthropi]NIH75681.1 hypothetical protein [Ochrobactrum sp. P20RRXII]PQZ66999.1 hypothetical protein CQ057_11205 [Ochrobactrum sp. MYb49]EXL03915.1 hypothetical protein BG46_26405 [Brucella anthropi]MBE0562965.1 hypothetical protein [Brucella anthropi]WKT95076.1 hypothetical protein QYR01_13505 [Brucella anthropi]